MPVDKNSEGTKNKYLIFFQCYLEYSGGFWNIFFWGGGPVNISYWIFIFLVFSNFDEKAIQGFNSEPGGSKTPGPTSSTINPPLLGYDFYNTIDSPYDSPRGQVPRFSLQNGRPR